MQTETYVDLPTVILIRFRKTAENDCGSESATFQLNIISIKTNYFSTIEKLETPLIN